ncbi:MAG: 4Fe-4S binding protein [Oscillospiraceae bacterium]|nr:4Fe-4S binding protein [Oscillospiraceae bacterium]
MSVFINMLFAFAVMCLFGLLFGALYSLFVDTTDSEPEDGESVQNCKNSGLRAFVRCRGTESEKRYTYSGANDCLAASLLADGPKKCEYACLGLGSCVAVCKNGAIDVSGGVAVVDGDKCDGCGACESACPRGVIQMIPKTAVEAVQCRSQGPGSATRKICDVGCIGCFACVKNCKYGAITVDAGIASIDYEKCTQCGECAEVCPRGIITAPAKPEEVEEEFDESEYFRLSAEEAEQETQVE